jgi:hypothetical protein
MLRIAGDRADASGSADRLSVAIRAAPASTGDADMPFDSQCLPQSAGKGTRTAGRSLCDGARGESEKSFSHALVFGQNSFNVGQIDHVALLDHGRSEM